MKNKLTFMNYSVIAAAALLNNKVNAQILYKDIDPDSIAEIPSWSILSDAFFLDLNGDNIPDVQFKVRSFSYYLASFTLKKVGNNNIQFLGKENIISLYNSGSYVYDKLQNASCLYDQSVIGGNNPNWLDSIKIDFNLYKNVYSKAAWACYYSGEWDDKKERYIGYSDKDNDGKTHYGWLRLSVYDDWNVSHIIAHDYAYSLIPNTSIIAGDSGQVTTKISDANLANIAIYSFNGKVYINFKQDFTEGKMSIINLMGQEVYKTDLNHTHTQLSLNIADGEYFVNIQTREGIINKKIFITN